MPARDVPFGGRLIKATSGASIDPDLLLGELTPAELDTANEDKRKAFRTAIGAAPARARRAQHADDVANFTLALVLDAQNPGIYKWDSGATPPPSPATASITYDGATINVREVASDPLDANFQVSITLSTQQPADDYLKLNDLAIAFGDFELAFDEASRSQNSGELRRWDYNWTAGTGLPGAGALAIEVYRHILAEDTAPPPATPNDRLAPDPAVFTASDDGTFGAWNESLGEYDNAVIDSGRGTSTRYVTADSDWIIDVTAIPRITSLPAIADATIGDIVNLSGVLYELVDDGDSPNVLLGTAAARTAPYTGSDRFEWQLAPPDDNTNPLNRALLPKSELGSPAPSPIWVRYTDSRGFATDLRLTHNATRDTTPDYAYDSPADGVGVSTPVGLDFSAAFFSNQAMTVGVDIHSTDRWEKLYQRQPAQEKTQYTAQSPIEIVNDEIRLDQTALDDFLYGAPIAQFTTSFVANNKQVPTTSVTIAADGDYYVEVVGYGGDIVPAVSLRNLTVVAAPTGVSDVIPTARTARYPMEIDGATLYLMRTSANILVYACSSALSNVTVRVYRPGGAGSRTGQQQVAVTQGAPTERLTLWQWVAAGSTPSASSIGYDGVTYIGNANNWSYNIGTAPSDNHILWAEDIQWQKPTSGTSGEWTQQFRNVYPTTSIEFATTQRPLSPNDILATYGPTARYRRFYRGAGRWTDWFPIEGQPTWAELISTQYWDLTARTANLLVPTHTMGEDIFENTWQIKWSVNGPQIHQQVGFYEAIWQGLSTPAVMGTTGVNIATLTAQGINDVTGDEYRGGVIGSQGATRNNGIGQRNPFAFNFHFERGTGDPLLGSKFSAVRFYNPSSWATTEVENRLQVIISMYKLEGGLGY